MRGLLPVLAALLLPGGPSCTCREPPRSPRDRSRNTRPAADRGVPDVAARSAFKAAPPGLMAIDAHGELLPAPAVARMGNSRLSPGQPLQALVYARDGSSLVGGGGEHRIRLWRPATGEEWRRLTDHRDQLLDLALSPDGELLASADDGGTILLWDLARARLVQRMERHQGAVVALAYAPDGKLLASAGVDDTIRFWAPRLGRERSAIKLDRARAPLDLAFVAARRIAVAHADGGVRLWHSARPGRPLRELTPRAPAAATALAVIPERRQLAAGHGDGTIRLWPLGGRDPARTLRGHRGPVQALVVDADGQTLFSGGRDRTVRAWALDGEAEGPRWTQNHQHPVGALAVSPDGATVAAGSWNIALHRAAGGARRRTIRGRFPVRAMARINQGETLVTASWRTVTAWRWESGVELGRVRVSPGWVVALASTGRDGRVVARDDRGALYAVDLKQGTSRRRASARGLDFAPQTRGIRPTGALRAALGAPGVEPPMALSPDGERVATVDRRQRITLWRHRDGAAQGTLQGHGGARITALLWSADGKTLASGAVDGTALVWKVEQPPAGASRAGP